MPEFQQTQKSTESKFTNQNQVTPKIQVPTSNPASIIQQARMNPKSLTHADVMQLQRTIGNRAVGKLLMEIGLIPSKATQVLPVQMQITPKEEEEPLQGKMAETIQLQEIPREEEPPLQGQFTESIQRQEIQESEEEVPLQGKFENKPEQEICPSCSTLPIQREKENLTNMPDNLKAGVENLSEIDMSNVRVHYNSSKPIEVGALAYTQGTDIHVAPGQEKHLPHEAWHVVQQAQGRVKSIFKMKGMAVNDDEELEHEADVMGNKAVQIELKNLTFSPINNGRTYQDLTNTFNNNLQTIQLLAPIILTDWIKQLKDKKVNHEDFSGIIDLMNSFERETGIDLAEIGDKEEGEKEEGEKEEGEKEEEEGEKEEEEGEKEEEEGEKEEMIEEFRRRMEEMISALDEKLTKTEDTQMVFDKIKDKVLLEINKEDIDNVKNYDFNAQVAFTAENYASWKRLGAGQGTIDDLRFIHHEIFEYKDLRQTTKNYLNVTKSEYLKSHLKALIDEMNFLLYLLKRKFGESYTIEQIAFSDDERTSDFAWAYFKTKIQDFVDPLDEGIPEEKQYAAMEKFDELNKEYSQRFKVEKLSNYLVTLKNEKLNQ